MKKLFLFSLLILSILIFVCSIVTDARNITSRDLAVEINATTQSLPKPSITLTWNSNDLINHYQISRKTLNATYWSTPSATLDSTQLSWTDTTVQSGIGYEYEIRSFGTGALIIQDSNIKSFSGFGYIYTGVNMPQIDYRGKVLLLVDTTFEYDLESELNTLHQDLVGEGWDVVTRYVPRAEKFDPAAVKKVKAIINEEYNKDQNNLNTIFIIGRVPVPYSGELNPDGHPDHLGAWPADVYYGFLNESVWTDTIVNNDTAASRAQNKNIPGDGKFDVTLLRGQVNLCVGRVDFYDMPQFSQSELQLLKNYLAKDHLYRTGGVKIESKALVSDNFGIFGGEGFGSNGWRNFTPLVGKDNVTAGDWFTTLGAGSYLWAYGCGGGSYTSAGGIGTTTDFTTKPVNAIFTMLFGSYFGDWDSQNNFMRAALASSPYTLTCAWAARPPWFFHTMGAGLPIGYSARLTQNNNLTLFTYKTNYYSSYLGNFTYVVGTNWVHIELLGDPTLHQFYDANTLLPPKNLTTIQTKIDNIDLTWDASKGPNVVGYNLYRSTDIDGGFRKINDAIIASTKYSDNYESEGTYYYMVKAVDKEETPTGEILETSMPAYSQIHLTDVPNNPGLVYTFSASPNPANQNSNISLTLSAPARVTLDVSDVNGNIVRHLLSGDVYSGTQNIAWNLADDNNSRIAAGVYFIRLVADGKTDIRKIIVLP